MKLIEKDWGILEAECSKYKFDFLPRVTMLAVPVMLQFYVCFLWFGVQLTIWNRDFIKNNIDANL